METILIVSSVLLWVVVVFNLVLTLALVRRVNTTSPEAAPSRPLVGLNVGDPAPDFTAQRLNGETVTLSTYSGRNIGLIFISTHCNPCHELLPKLVSVEPEARSAGVELILVSTDGAEATSAYMEKNDFHLPVLVAPRESNTFLNDYKSLGTPSHCFITAEGNVYAAGSPYFEEGEWKGLTEFLSQSSIPVARERR